jgi:hypothetical protein
MTHNFERPRVPTNTMKFVVIQKWSPGVLSEGYVPFPKKLLRCLHRLFPGPDCAEDLAVVLAVVDFKRPDQSRLPSLAFLSFLAGLEEQKFIASLERLEKKSYVQVSGDAEGLDVNLGNLFKRIEEETKG